MADYTLKPNDRFAVVGKTGSGKSQFAMVLAGTFAATLPAPWEVWWMDTKGDSGDIAALRKWGFRNGASKKDQEPEGGGQRGALYWKVESTDRHGNHLDTRDQVQHLLRVAYERGHVVIVIDEYTQVVISSQNPGSALLDVFTRGRGKDVGLIGLTQEPVYVPRQLLSQASHMVLFSLSFPNDVKKIKEIYPEYRSPMTLGDPYGFYWGWLDGPVVEWRYYRNQQAWYQSLGIAQPSPR